MLAQGSWTPSGAGGTYMENWGQNLGGGSKDDARTPPKGVWEPLGREQFSRSGTQDLLSPLPQV